MQIELRNIRKTFGSVQANAGISLLVPTASIQGILGENGAGKSTLMKILSGFILPDSGDILLNGSKVVIQSPADALGQGVGMLHQDPLDFPPMKILDNFILGRRGALFLDRRKAAREFREIAAQFGFSLDEVAYVDTLTVGERQQLEILRLLWFGAKALILDEPTTGISRPQKEKLFSTLRMLASRGMTIVFVSHKLEDVELLCSRVAVLRQGELVGTADPPYETRSLVRMMFTRDVAFTGKKSLSPGRPILSLRRVSLEAHRLHIQDVNFEARAGEVIGLAGMEGSGQSVLLAACAGLTRTISGQVRLGERDVTGLTYHAFMKHGVAYLPAARLEQGLVAGLSLADHFVLSEGTGGMFIDRARAADIAAQRIRSFNIKGAPSHRVESLSGGNQQRLLLALLKESLSLVLLEHPTRGLDIESTLYIWTKLRDRCAQGTTIVFISADLDEVLQYSDRVLVFFSGRVSSPIPASALTVETLGGLIGGKGWEELSEAVVSG
jgi:simple sugar transport system ATP-binding protein